MKIYYYDLHIKSTLCALITCINFVNCGICTYISMKNNFTSKKINEE